ncbi:biotin/methionine sulfoxide reductase [Sagittula marina]|uniref:Biotin/methionine sulfoxide reductase n=1 Tax=Sagittula marina TaxID=943940 RepID=A0A7W6DS53_9RHOB|nr:biotin/methionine sulfoxide reductase [Sagittula marina]
MKYTSSHWGSYQFEPGGPLMPLASDPDPSRIGRGWASASQDRQSRILRPAIRQGWLDGDKGRNRCGDSYVEVSWERAISLAAGALGDTVEAHGNGAVFGGSYGWSSAGRFHHAQSQMRRFLNLAGGCVSSRDTYSHAAAEVMFPHILGLSNKAFQDQMTAMPLVAEHCELLLAVGGISRRTAQITSSGTTTHEVGPWLEQMRAKGTRIIELSPARGDGATEWLSIRPGTDTACLLALAYEIHAAGLADEAFLARYTSGWETFRDYLTGAADGTPKTADWAAPICDLDAQVIRDLARDLAGSKSMIAVAWGLQRAEYGEQPLWAGLALASIIGQIGQPGTGYAFGYGSTTPVGRAARLIPWPSMPQGRNPVDDYIPVARIADMLLNPGGAYKYDGETRIYPDIKLIWWTGGNPFHHHQDLNRLEEAWTRPDTVIVNDHSWTATARRADIVLPATAPLEREDILMNRRDPTLLWMSRYHAPVGDALDDHEIFARLSQQMGFGDAFTEGRDTEGWFAWLWERSQEVAKTHGFALPDLNSFRAEGRFDIPDAAETRIALGDFVADPEANALATESGRITLANEWIGALGLPNCPGHPTWMEPTECLTRAQPDEFHLVSGQPDTRLHSQNDRGSEALADKIKGREAASFHPDTAAALGLVAGNMVRLYNERGACLAGVRLNDGLRRDCVFLPTGAWFDPQTVNGARLEVHGNPNALTRDVGCSELSQGNTAHSCLVRAEKWTGVVPDLTIDTPPVKAS